jgi:hypothetical protein
MITKYAKDALLLVSIELFPFRGKPEIPNRELLEFAGAYSSDLTLPWM